MEGFCGLVGSQAGREGESCRRELVGLGEGGGWWQGQN